MSTASQKSGSPLSILRCDRCDFAVKPGRQRFKVKAFLEFDMEQIDPYFLGTKVCIFAMEPRRCQELGCLVFFWWLQPAYDKPRSKKAFFDPSRSQDFLFISGTKMRALGKNGENPPDGFRCPGGWKVLVEYCNSLAPTGNGKFPKLVRA